MQHAIKTVKTLYPEYNSPGVAKVCLTTLAKVLQNIIQNPSEQKFQIIKTTNQAIKNKIAKVTGGLMFLKSAGFVEQGENFVLEKVDVNLLNYGL